MLGGSTGTALGTLGALGARGVRPRPLPPRPRPLPAAAIEDFHRHQVSYGDRPLV